jgi:hypothetical protein
LLTSKKKFSPSVRISINTLILGFEVCKAVENFISPPTEFFDQEPLLQSEEEEKMKHEEKVIQEHILFKTPPFKILRTPENSSPTQNETFFMKIDEKEPELKEEYVPDPENGELKEEVEPQQPGLDDTIGKFFENSRSELNDSISEYGDFFPYKQRFFSSSQSRKSQSRYRQFDDFFQSGLKMKLEE